MENTLFVYGGEPGLPSIDLESLRVMCIVKFAGANINIKFNRNPLFSGVGKLPYISLSNKKITDFQQMYRFFQENGKDINSKFSIEETSLIEGYETMTFQKLHPYFMYTLYGDANNFENVRGFYAKRITIPFNFYYPQKYYDITNNIMEVMSGFSLYYPVQFHNVDQMIIDAKKFVNDLSCMLGNNEWFMNKKPSTLDAMIFSYLAILLHINLPNNVLQLHITECENLVQYVNRINQKFFNEKAPLKKTTKYTGDILKKVKGNFSSDFKIKICSCVVAFIAMGVYAVSMGLLKMSTGDEYVTSYDYEQSENEEEN